MSFFENRVRNSGFGPTFLQEYKRICIQAVVAKLASGEPEVQLLGAQPHPLIHDMMAWLKDTYAMTADHARAVARTAILDYANIYETQNRNDELRSQLTRAETGEIIGRLPPKKHTPRLPEDGDEKPDKKPRRGR